MSRAALQFDLFADAPAPQQPEQQLAPARGRRAPRALARPDAPADLEAMARALEQSHDYRVLRRLRPRPVIPRRESRYPRLGVVVDVETTGLRHGVDEIIEIGLVAFTFADDGAAGDVVAVYGALQQPAVPVPPEITRLTGITDAMVAGRRIDVAEVERIASGADLVIAHNAAFDRPFCEGLSPVFASLPWACSAREIPWSDYGFEGAKLGYLVGQAGLFHDGHRAVDDCHALLEVLLRPAPAAAAGDGPATPFAALLASSRRMSVRIWAERSPFDMKDQLKARGYRWNDGSDGRPRAWWTEVPAEAEEEELRFLREEIYQWPEASPLRQLLGACDRYRK
ncbi:3'-5' exonuclease [Camelimonas abortus]|uniref:3'-5' exonuclease n=1 Tax=Camelimonas abortus TaxID=1017184 RepID=A0ABV7LB91_9HYPH